MVVQSEHRRVENTEDFKEWGWGDNPPAPSDEPDLLLVDLLKEWVQGIASEAHEKSCASGAAIAFDELAQIGFFVLRGITDNGLLVEFQGTDQFIIYDELAIVTEAINHFKDPQHISAHLRRLADAIDAANPPIGPVEAMPT